MKIVRFVSFLFKRYSCSRTNIKKMDRIADIDETTNFNRCVSRIIGMNWPAYDASSTSHEWRLITSCSVS